MASGYYFAVCNKEYFFRQERMLDVGKFSAGGCWVIGFGNLVGKLELFAQDCMWGRRVLV